VVLADEPYQLATGDREPSQLAHGGPVPVEVGDGQHVRLVDPPELCDPAAQASDASWIY